MISQFCGVFCTVPHAASVLAGYQIVFCFYRGLTHETLTLTAASQYRRRLGYERDVANHMLLVLNGFPLSPLTTPVVLYIQLHLYIYEDGAGCTTLCIYILYTHKSHTHAHTHAHTHRGCIYTGCFYICIYLCVFSRIHTYIDIHIYTHRMYTQGVYIQSVFIFVYICVCFHGYIRSKILYLHITRFQYCYC